MAADKFAVSPLASPQSGWLRVAALASAKIRIGLQNVRSIRLQISGPQKFTIVSLLIIAGVMTVTSFSAARTWLPAIARTPTLSRVFTFDFNGEFMIVDHRCPVKN